MLLAIVTDEISLDPITAVELGREWGIRHFELRSVASGRLPNISDADRRRLEDLARRDDVVLTALSPGFFKTPFDDETTRRQLSDDLPRAIELAVSLGIDQMIFFAARKEDRLSRPEATQRAAALLATCADQLEEANIRLLLENEHICWADTGVHALEILEAARHPNIRLNWDPCNAVWAGGKPFPEEYERIRDHIGHLHVKDTARDALGRFHGVPIGEGEVGWREILRALRRDGWPGPYTVETHFGPKVQASRACTQNLERLLIEVA